MNGIDRADRSGRADPGDELDLNLERWFTNSAPWRARNGLLGDVLAQTAATRQAGRRPRWFVRRWDTASILPRPLAIVIATLLVVAVGSGAIVAGSLVVSSIARPPVTVPRWTGWQAVAGTAAFGTRTVTDVIPVGSRLIAIGGAVTGTHNIGAAWASADGLVWHELEGDSSFNDDVMARVAQHGGTLVALGHSCSGGQQYTCGGGQFSVSTDGQSWHAPATVIPDPGPGGITSDYESIAVTPAGFAAVGVSYDVAGDAIGASVATSTDGMHWTFLPPTQAQFAARSMGAVASGPGGLVAIGTDVALTNVVWTSGDGSSWELVSGYPLPRGRLTDIAGGPGRYVAVGSEGADAVAWTSTDGLTWKAAPESQALSGAMMTRALWTGSTFVSLGRSSAGDGLAWVSDDGLSWSRLDTGSLFHGTPITAAVMVGSRLELFGTSESGALVVAISAP